jgi:hypothetical protein
MWLWSGGKGVWRWWRGQRRRRESPISSGFCKRKQQTHRTHRHKHTEADGRKKSNEAAGSQGEIHLLFVKVLLSASSSASRARSPTKHLRWWWPFGGRRGGGVSPVSINARTLSGSWAAHTTDGVSYTPHNKKTPAVAAKKRSTKDWSTVLNPTLLSHAWAT